MSFKDFFQADIIIIVDTWNRGVQFELDNKESLTSLIAERLLCFKIMAVGKKRWAKGLTDKRPRMITHGELTDYSNQRSKRFFII